MRIERHRTIRQIAAVQMPKAQKRPAQQESVKLALHPEDVQQINWDVPFTVQAPNANWDEVHKEACEEASALMILRYFDGKTIAGPADAETGINELIY